LYQRICMCVYYKRRERINESNKTCKLMNERTEKNVYVLPQKKRNTGEFFEYIHLESVMRVLMHNVL
jgi:hypothetical protein